MLVSSGPSSRATTATNSGPSNCDWPALPVQKASCGDRYGRQRAAADLGARARRLPKVLHRPIYAAGEVLYAAGVVVGGVEWLLRERR